MRRQTESIVTGAEPSHSGASRWLLLAVLTSITILNYIDRQAVTILFPQLAADLHLPHQTYATLVTLFLVAYTSMYAFGGWLVDRVGARNGLAGALAWWSLATAATALVHGAGTLKLSRILLGVAQPLVFSAGVKACAEFFPAEQRAMAAGIFSAGSGVGALIATPLLATAALHIGWRSAMLVPASVGLLMTPVWMAVYSGTRRLPVNRQEAIVTTTWLQLLKQRSSWALILPRAIGDSLWYFCFFWIPTYLSQDMHLDLKRLALFGWMPFLFADLGSVVGGSLSDALVRRGGAPAGSRVKVLVCIAVVAPLGGLIGAFSSLWVIILLLGLLAFASQCWTTTTIALATDVVPKSNVGKIVGMMGTAGGIGGAAFSQLTGATVHRFGYAPAFVLAAVLMPAAVGLLLILLRAERRAAPKECAT